MFHWISNTPLKMIARNTLHKKWSFPLRISEVNMTKSAVSTGFVTSTEENLEGKLHFCLVTYGGCKSMWRFESNRNILKNRSLSFQFPLTPATKIWVSNNGKAYPEPIQTSKMEILEKYLTGVSRYLVSKNPPS